MGACDLIPLPNCVAEACGHSLSGFRFHHIRCAEARRSVFVDLGGLRAFMGSQKYPIPTGVDLTEFPSVVIWCQQFSVLISPADLSFEQSG